MRVKLLCEMGESFPIGKENRAIEKFKSALYISERANWELGKSVRLSNFSAHKTLLNLCSNGKSKYQQKASQVRRKFQS